MPLKVGILGLGFIGMRHFDAYAKLRGARVAAICEQDKVRLCGDWSSIDDKQGVKAKRRNLSGISLYSDAAGLCRDPELDVIDITLPTHLHAKFTIMALNNGKHVICEKPMALNSREGKRMLAAAKASGKRLLVAHCIRYWPGFAKAREIIKSGKYGKVVSAAFRRISGRPFWSWQDWLHDPKKSGLCALDLHIHDTDFILYAFGKPKAVSSYCAGFKKHMMDQILTVYHYRQNQLITAEAIWEHAPGRPSSQGFVLTLEGATLAYADAKLTLYAGKSKGKEIKLSQANGYELELKDFVDCILKGKASKVVTPASALQSLLVVEAEIKSARTGKTVPVKF